MDPRTVIQQLQRAVPAGRFEIAGARDHPAIYVEREDLVETARALRDDPVLRFDVLVDLTAVDWLPREPRFEVVYHLVCLGSQGPRSPDPASEPLPAPKRLRMKVRVPGRDPIVPTVSQIWPGAGWAEREVWDLFGIVFNGHPDLRRILMPDEWEGHPLRKDYPVQVDISPRTYAPLEVSEREFVENIRAARRVPGGEP